jgi:linoleoyl-CoA desaturase
LEVDRLLAEPGVYARARRQLVYKTLIGFAILVGAWTYLVFGALFIGPVHAAQALVSGAALLLGATIVSVCVLHDANHGAVFRTRRANHLLGWSVDVVLGFSSYVWRYKHNVSHHTYPNVDGYDDDINHSPAVRLAPTQPSHPWYRWQHLYIWPLYALALPRWHATDLLAFRRVRLGSMCVPPPKGWDLAGLIAGKVLFACWAFALPMHVYPWWLVLSTYLALAMTGSFLMAIVFQLAHCVDEATFLSAADFASEEPVVWATHEVESTIDFAQSNQVLTWCIGGLNYQIEHHLFPRLPHTLYPRIAPMLRELAEQFGVRYIAKPTVTSALRSHYSHLRAMGRAGLPVEIEMG